MGACSFGSHDGVACRHQAHVLKTHVGKEQSRQQAAELVLLKRLCRNPQQSTSAYSLWLELGRKAALSFRVVC